MQIVEVPLDIPSAHSPPLPRDSNSMSSSSDTCGAIALQRKALEQDDTWWSGAISLQLEILSQKKLDRAKIYDDIDGCSKIIVRSAVHESFRTCTAHRKVILNYPINDLKHAYVN